MPLVQNLFQVGGGRKNGAEAGREHRRVPHHSGYHLLMADDPGADPGQVLQPFRRLRPAKILEGHRAPNRGQIPETGHQQRAAAIQPQALEREAGQAA